MANTKLRELKEVNGWKVNHPHNAANTVYAIFTFVFSAFPLAFLFLPLISEPGQPVDFVSGLNGLAIFKYLIDFLTNLFTALGNGGAVVVPSNPQIDYILQNVNPVMADAIGYTFVGLGAIMLLFFIFSLDLIITSIVHISKGYLKRAGKVKRIAVADFVFSIIFFIAILFIFFTFKAQTKQDLFVWLTGIPVGLALSFVIFFSIFYETSFKDSILETELEIQDNAPTSEEHISKVHEVTKVNYEQSSTLPPDLTSIGGHQFAENQSLTVANIPLGIDKLGPGAFANCLNLKVVSIPNSVKEIGYNCFFNCLSLERLNFAGTKEEWRRIKRGSNWLAKAATTDVVCLDGTVIVNPYH